MLSSWCVALHNLSGFQPVLSARFKVHLFFLSTQQTSENAIYRPFLKHFLRQVWQEVDVCLGRKQMENRNLDLESKMKPSSSKLVWVWFNLTITPWDHVQQVTKGFYAMIARLVTLDRETMDAHHALRR